MVKEIEVVWTEKAMTDFYQIISFLEKVWNDKTIERFIGETNKALEKIQSHPFTFTHSAETKIYKRKINRYITLYFIIDSYKIVLLSFFDGRQNPDNLLKDNF
jgi:plasmid stabilization system protein ParE